MSKKNLGFLTDFTVLRWKFTFRMNIKKVKLSVLLGELLGVLLGLFVGALLGPSVGEFVGEFDGLLLGVQEKLVYYTFF